MLQRLVALADSLDSKGLNKEADKLDRIITAVSQKYLEEASIVGKVVNDPEFKRLIAEDKASPGEGSENFEKTKDMIVSAVQNSKIDQNDKETILRNVQNIAQGISKPWEAKFNKSRRLQNYLYMSWLYYSGMSPQKYASLTKEGYFEEVVQTPEGPTSTMEDVEELTPDKILDLYNQKKITKEKMEELMKVLKRGSKVIEQLIVLADSLDSKGFVSEADQIDKLIKEAWTYEDMRIFSKCPKCGEMLETGSEQYKGVCDYCTGKKARPQIAELN